MGEWSPNSQSDVASMTSGDFRHNEQSATIKNESSVRIEFTDAAGNKQILKKDISLQAEEIIDASKRLARVGILTEPSSAQAWSGARKLVDNGRISQSDRTVVILTGTGLKAQSVFS